MADQETVFLEDLSVYTGLTAYLNEQYISYKEKHHRPTYTSSESARARSDDLAIGGKALLMKIDADFKLFVLSAERKLDSKALKSIFSAKRIRFATVEELKEITGLNPGSVPPFGKPVLPFDLFIDVSITKNIKIAFNAGSLVRSFTMDVVDYLKASKGEVLSFSTL